MPERVVKDELITQSASGDSILQGDNGPWRDAKLIHSFVVCGMAATFGGGYAFWWVFCGGVQNVIDSNTHYCYGKHRVLVRLAAHAPMPGLLNMHVRHCFVEFMK